MKTRLLSVVASAVALLALMPSAIATQIPINSNGLNTNGLITAPDGGSSIILLAMGCTGLAIAARKRFKR